MMADMAARRKCEIGGTVKHHFAQRAPGLLSLKRCARYDRPHEDQELLAFYMDGLRNAGVPAERRCAFISIRVLKGR
jgi:hypothetical protein